MFTDGNTPHNKGKTGLAGSHKVSNAGRFKKGHTPWSKGLVFENAVSSDEEESKAYIRMNLQDHQQDDIKADSVSRTDSSQVVKEVGSGVIKSSMILRPRFLKADKEKVTSNNSHIIESEKMFDMFNLAYQQHRETPKTCKRPWMEPHSDRKWGACIMYRVRCANCWFVTPTLAKLYSEVENNKPGPNPAGTNIALVSAGLDSPIGSTKTQEILARVSVPPPCKSGMQRNTDRISKVMVKQNKDDMKDKVEQVKAYNKKKGQPENVIDVTLDGRYPTATRSSRKKPGLNASQAQMLAIEQNTPWKFVVASSSLNQLCWKGAWLRGKGFDAECPGHEDCTATLHRTIPISEYAMGKEIGNQLALQGMLIRYATTDGDARSAKGVEDAIHVLYPMWEVQRLADPVHLSQHQFRAGMRAEFSETMFHGQTKEENKDLKKMFSLDLKCRSSMILNQLMNEYNKDTEKVCKKLPTILSTTVQCYGGDCSSCLKESVVCKGTVSDNWWTRSFYLSTYNITVLKIDEIDEIILLELLKMILSEEAVNSMRMFHTTNKNEGVHRALSVSLPKNVTHGKNMEGRLHSAIHRTNNRPGTSAKMKSKELNIKVSEDCETFFDKMDREYTYKRNYEQKPEVKIRRLQQTAVRLEEHKIHKELHKKRPDYVKGQLDPVPDELMHDAYCKKKMPK